jgi:hypothetical protein
MNGSEMIDDKEILNDAWGEAFQKSQLVSISLIFRFKIIF